MTTWRVWAMAFLVVAFSPMLVPGDASAVLTKCSVGGDPTVDGIGTSDVTFRGPDADDCYGLEPGGPPNQVPTEARINAIDTTVPGGITWGSNYTEIVKAEESNSFSDTSTFDGIEWTLSTANGDDQSGTWTLEFESDPNKTETYDLVVAIKAATPWAAWLFQDEVFTTDGSGSGTFAIQWENNGGNIPGLSHIAIYLQPTDGGGGTTEVPAPATLTLLGVALVGLSGLGALWRRRSR